MSREDVRAVLACARSGWISSAGPSLDRFEAQWASFCGRRFGVAVSSGTAALQTAVAALDIQPGDEVILPAFTIISCALAVIRNGARPVLVDCDPRTWCMDVSEVERKITSRTRAVMPVHIYGHPVRMEPLLRLCRRRGLAVIEDAAEAHGAECRLSGKWRRCGSFGEISCFSFYANKLITTGEGGMLVTDRERLAERCRKLRNLCFEPGRRFRHESLGFNFRLTNLQAALGLSQLRRIKRILERKRRIAHEYVRRLKGVEGIELPAHEPWARPVCWMFAIVLRGEAGMDACELSRRLKARGVETRPFFLGMHEQPALLRRGLFQGERYPVAERLARRGLYLPSGLTLTQAQIAEVSSAVRASLS